MKFFMTQTAKLTESSAPLLSLSVSTKSPVDGCQTQAHMTEEDNRWRQPWPLLICHYVAITIVPPQFVGC